jgi:hypothetical protein
MPDLSTPVNDWDRHPFFRHTIDLGHSHCLEKAGLHELRRRGEGLRLSLVP